MAGIARREFAESLTARLIIDCRNLIGDTIYLIKPLRQFLAARSCPEVALGVGHGLPAEIVRRSFPGMRVETTESIEALWPGADRIVLSARAAFDKTRADHGHISTGYARTLGIELQGGIEPDTAWLPPARSDVPAHIALAPFSVSCAANRGEPRNITLEETDWLPLLRILRGCGLPVRVVGGPGERLTAVELGFSDSDYFSAAGIDDLVSFLRCSRLVIGVDTGICHVSSCAGVPTVVLWSSAASVQFIGETWAPRTRIVQIGFPMAFDPYRISGLLAGAVQELLGRDEQPSCREPHNLSSAASPGDAIFPELESFKPLAAGDGALGGWSGHLAFARDLAASLRPRLFVEVGTQQDESFVGFCRMVADTAPGCACYAVKQASEQLVRYDAENEASFSQMLRGGLEEARQWFADESIDLLHIDVASAGNEEFGAWYRKLAPGGVVLLPDSGSRGSAVSRVWEQLPRNHEAFEFPHGRGLVVIRKQGGRPSRGGILDYLFKESNAGAIRRYYAAWAERLQWNEDGGAAAAVPGRALTDPPADIVDRLITPDESGTDLGWVELPVADPGLARNDCWPYEGETGRWRASTPDPWMIVPAGVNCSEFRYFVLTMSCSSEELKPNAQLFWSGPQRPGFNEQLSVRIPVIPDGLPHTYLVDLHAGAGADAVNSLWRHNGNLDGVRLDPLDAPGEFHILRAGFAHQDRADVAAFRERLGMPPLRTELSYRYLRGSGIEIGALHNPLALRPDAYVRYADRLTLEEARAHYPELERFPLVSPSIICDARALTPIGDQTLDFVIANHTLVHILDPLGAIREWLRVIRPGGHLYVAVPDYRNPLDRRRGVTTVDHLIADFERRLKRQELDRAHYREYVASAHPELGPHERTNLESRLESSGYAIHFHTFNRDTFMAFIHEVVNRFPSALVELRQGSAMQQTEYIAILRRV